MQSKTLLLFLIILIEGYVVLACELLAIRLLIPFVGSGTETISIIISAVLLPLAVGYHAGGRRYERAYAAAQKKGRTLSVRKLLLKNILSALIIFTPGLSYLFLEIFFSLLNALGIHNRLAQTACYSALFLVVPVFLLGQTVPLVSHYFSQRKLNEITGKMLFFSTTGSFLGSVFSTIVLMMSIGVHNTVIVTLSLLILLCTLLVRRPFSYEIIVCACIFGLLYLFNNSATLTKFGIISNNAYNTVMLYDVPKDNAIIFSVNRSAASQLGKDGNPDKIFPYIRWVQDTFIKPAMQSGQARDILAIGAGGFTVGLGDEVNRYTYVDIDPALKQAAEEHFLPKKLPKNQSFVAASARAFVNSSKEKYDLILIDAYTNVIAVPMETTTREFLLDVKRLLKDNGALVVNMISSPTFSDKFTVRYDNTFSSVFPAYTRQIISPFDPWTNIDPKTHKPSAVNALYIYFNNALAEDDGVYTDDRNSFSIDR